MSSFSCGLVAGILSPFIHSSPQLSRKNLCKSGDASIRGRLQNNSRVHGYTAQVRWLASGRSYDPTPSCHVPETMGNSVLSYSPRQTSRLVGYNAAIRSAKKSPRPIRANWITTHDATTAQRHAQLRSLRHMVRVRWGRRIDSKHLLSATTHHLRIRISMTGRIATRCTT